MKKRKEVKSLLEDYRPEIEEKIKPHLDGLRGVIVKTRLPQVWSFRTEQESVSIFIDKDGKTKVKAGESQAPDVTIEWKQDFLCSVLSKKSAKDIPSGERPDITIHSPKGHDGYSIVRRYLRI